MRSPAARVLLLLLGASPLSAQTVLWDERPPAPELTLHEDTRLALEDGRLSLELNSQQNLQGSANASARDVIERRFPSADEQRISVIRSERNIRFGLGKSNGNAAEPKATTGHLQGRKLTGRRKDGRWTYTLAGAEPGAAETSALKQFAAYAEAVSSLGLLYGNAPRNVGDTWKPDLGNLKQISPGLEGDITCKLEELAPAAEGDTIARVSVTGRLTARLEKGGLIQLALNGVIRRSLRDRVELEIKANANFRYAGEFGKSGTSAEITAPATLTRTVTVSRSASAPESKPAP